MAVELLAHWWDGQWAAMARRDVWVERLDDGRYQVRWRGGEWRDRDGVRRTTERLEAWKIVQTLISEGDGWRLVDQED